MDDGDGSGLGAHDGETQYSLLEPVRQYAGQPNIIMTWTVHGLDSGSGWRAVA